MSASIFPVLRRLRRADPIWRYYSNLGSTTAYALSGSRHLATPCASVLRDLNRNGIAIRSLNELTLDTSVFEQLLSETETLLKLRQPEITRLSERAASTQTVGEKTFNCEMLGTEPIFNERDVFANLGMNPVLLNIANAYLSMYSKLRYYNVWLTFASGGEARESQLWHFDREDNYILKVFLYLDDVDEGAGPFTYAPETHGKGRRRNLKPESFVEGGVRRTTDDQMRVVYPEDKWVRAVGKKGTIVFADTRGYHKGGEARTRDRLMYTCMYTSPASQSKNLIKFDENFDRSGLDARQLRALGLN